MTQLADLGVAIDTIDLAAHVIEHITTALPS